VCAHARTHVAATFSYTGAHTTCANCLPSHIARMHRTKCPRTPIRSPCGARLIYSGRSQFLSRLNVAFLSATSCNPKLSYGSFHLDFCESRTVRDNVAPSHQRRLTHPHPFLKAFCSGFKQNQINTIKTEAAERLLGSWVRIPPGAWMFVLYSVCVVK
jgi:hypothetical protein